MTRSLWILLLSLYLCCSASADTANDAYTKSTANSGKNLSQSSNLSFDSFDAQAPVKIAARSRVENRKNRRTQAPTKKIKPNLENIAHHATTSKANNKANNRGKMSRKKSSSQINASEPPKSILATQEANKKTLKKTGKMSRRSLNRKPSSVEKGGEIIVAK